MKASPFLTLLATFILYYNINQSVNARGNFLLLTLRKFAIINPPNHPCSIRKSQTIIKNSTRIWRRWRERVADDL